MYKSENQGKTYHILQPRSHQQNHSSVKSMQQIYLLPNQPYRNHSTYNNYQANRDSSAQRAFNPQSNVGYYYGQNNPVNHKQYHGCGQLQFLSHPHGLNSGHGLQVNNGKYSNNLSN